MWLTVKKLNLMSFGTAHPLSMEDRNNLGFH